MTELIAEIAQAHEGSLGIAHSYIDMLADCGVDTVKFQTHIASAESSPYEQFRVNFSYEDQTRFEYWKRMEFTPEQWAGLKKHCEDKRVEFLSSPFSVEAVELLEKIGVKRYKIGSGELTNYLMLDCIGRTGKPIILSSGMSDWKELENTIGFLRDYSSQLFLLQCTTAYPTKPEQWGLGVMKEMRERFTLPVGFSDHSADIFAGLAAATLGAEILEFHAAFHHNMFGPDAKASLTPEQIKQLVKGVREINNSLRDSVSKSNVDSFGTLKIMFGKSLALRRYMQAGEILNVSDLESKKPGDQGIPACLFKEVLGKKLNKELPANAFLNLRDLKDEKN